MKNIVFTLFTLIILFKSVDILSFSTVATIDSSKQHREAFYYLNQLRTSAGLNFLFQNDYLDEASLNHSNYLVKNSKFGHFEDNKLAYFSGERPLDRVYNVGYKSTQIIENISSNAKSYKNSIDGLFSAIYHRFAFLDFSISEIGIGITFDKSNINKNAFVYNMGNSKLNQLCLNQKRECVLGESLQLSYSDFVYAFNWKKITNPKIVVYPYANQRDVPTSFYHEDPDPLPYHDINGFPISIQFNSYFISNVNIQSFDLYDSSFNRVNTIFIDEITDINRLFKKGEFAIYPIKKLNRNSSYHVKVTYFIDNKLFLKEWSFITKK